MAPGWYLGCSSGLIPTSEEALYQNLIQTAPVEMVDLKEPKELQEQPSLQKESDNAEKGTKDKKAAKDKKNKQGSASATQASQANVSTHSATKAIVDATTASATTGVGSPSVAPSLSVPTPSQRKWNAPSAQLCKRKTIASDPSVTSSESHSISTFIENMDMAKLIERYSATKLHHPSYTRIQEFLAKVCPFTLLFYASLP